MATKKTLVKSGSLKFNPPVPAFPTYLFIGVPDANGSVRNWVNVLFADAVKAWGQENAQQKAYARAFLKTYQDKDQVSDVGRYFALDGSQELAVEYGTAPTNFSQAIVSPAHDATKDAAVEGGTAYPGPNVHGVGGVTFADPLSLWNWKVKSLQHNINVGYDGTQTGTGVDTGL